MPKNNNDRMVNDQFSMNAYIKSVCDLMPADPKDYWYRLKKREAESNGIELSIFCRQLKLPSADCKKYTVTENV